MQLNQSKVENNRINQTVKTALENLKNLVDVNTIIGKPIKTKDNGIKRQRSKLVYKSWKKKS